MIRENNVKKCLQCLKCLDVSRHLEASFFLRLFILFRVVCSLEHDQLKSTMSSQKPGKTKQKSLLSRILRLQKYQRGDLKAAKIMLLLSLLKQLVPSYPGRGGGGGYSQKNWVVVCGPIPKILSVFMTKLSEIPYPFYDLTKNSKPYL